MEEPKKILAALDMHNGMQNLIHVALAVARAFHSEITLFHAIPEVPGSPFQKSQLKESTEDVLEQMRSEVILDVPRVNTHVAFGPPVSRILDAARDYKADLIMIGSGAKEPGDRFQLGVTAEQIVRHSPSPVWVVKPGQRVEVDRILCPVDFSQHSRDALDLAVGLALAFDGDLAVVNVIEPLSNIYPGRPLVHPEEQGSYAEDQSAEFERFLEDVDFRGVRREKIILEGTPHEEILRLVRERGCRLIVMGSEGRTGLMRFILGSVAEKVIREVPCSMVTVKAG